MLSNYPIDLTVDLKDLLPQVVINEWLPNESKSILFLFQGFDHYPPHPTHYTLPSNFQSVLHQTPIWEFDYEYLSTIPPPTPDISQAYQEAMKISKYPILSVTLQPQLGHLVTLLTWTFTYWKKIGHAVDIWKKWKVALTWVQQCSMFPPATELCQSLLLGLSSI